MRAFNSAVRQEGEGSAIPARSASRCDVHSSLPRCFCRYLEFDIEPQASEGRTTKGKRQEGEEAEDRAGDHRARLREKG
jgi:hypothetical protein